MSLRRSKISKTVTREDNYFKKGEVQPHVKRAQLDKIKDMQAPPTVFTKDLIAKGFTNQPVYKNDTGCPTKMTHLVAEEICARIANGEGLDKICRDSHMPVAVTVRHWILNNEWFRDKYGQATKHRMDKMAEEILEISDAEYNNDAESTQRSALRVSTRKWLMGKLMPKKYGDKVDVEHTGAIQHQHAVQVVLPHNGRNIIDVTTSED